MIILSLILYCVCLFGEGVQHLAHIICPEVIVNDRNSMQYFWKICSDKILFLIDIDVFIIVSVLLVSTFHLYPTSVLTVNEVLIGCALTHPNSSDRLHRSHVTQYCCGYCKLEYL